MTALPEPKRHGQRDRQQPDGRRHQTMTVFVKNIADHFGPGVKKHVVTEGRRPVRRGELSSFTGDATTEKKQRNGCTTKIYGESMGPNTRVHPRLRGTSTNGHGLALMGAGRGSGAELLVLRQPIFLHFRRAVFIGPAVHHRLDLEVPVGRWLSRNPFQSIRLPGIPFGLLASKQAPEEVIEEKNL